MSKVFIDRVTSNVGFSIFESLRNDHILEEEPHQFFCIHGQQSSVLSPLQVKHKQTKDPRQVLECMEQCDIVILDLHNSDLEELEYYIRGLQASENTSERTVILISDVLVWGDTPPKLQELLEEGEEGDEIEESRLKPEQSTVKKDEGEARSEHSETVGREQESLKESLQEDPSVYKPPRFRIIQFEDRDFLMRKSLPKYEGWKTIENQVLRLNNTGHLHAYVVCAGILYGYGETVLESHFTAAWTESEEGVPIIAPGYNLLPMIHVTDLSAVIRKTIETQPEHHYILAVDFSPKNTQVNLVQAISSYLGNGLVRDMPLSDVLMLDWCEYLTLNLWMTPSTFTPEDLAYPNGLVDNLQRINEEFNLYRGLTPLRVFITGPPASGKTYFGKKLAETFNLPYLHVGSVLEEAQSGDSPIAERVKETVSTLRQQMIDEAESKKKKNQELDYSKFNPRVPEEMVAEVFRWKLDSVQVKNRGYVLDGWPRRYEDASRLFTESDTPSSVIVLKAANDALVSRVKMLPDTYTTGTHFNDEHMKRRLTIYRDLTEKQGPPVWEFFAQKEIDLLEVDSNSDAIENFKSMKEYLERKPVNNFRKFIGPRSAPEPTQENIVEAVNEEIAEQPEEEEKTAKPDMEELLMMEHIKSKEKDMLEYKSQPYRHYLFEQVVPWVFEGLVEITKETPEDPVEALASFLERKSKELKENA